MEETIQYLQIATNVIIILLFIGLVILVFNLIKALKKVSSKVDDVSSQINGIKSKVEPVIDKVKDLTDNVNLVVSKVIDNVDVLSNVVNKIKDTADSIIEFEEKIRHKVETPVLETANTISAVSAGIKTFFETYKKSKKNPETAFDREIEDYIELKDSMDEVNKELEEVNARLTDLQK